MVVVETVEEAEVVDVVVGVDEVLVDAAADAMVEEITSGTDTVAGGVATEAMDITDDMGVSVAVTTNIMGIEVMGEIEKWTMWSLGDFNIHCFVFRHHVS